MWAQNMGNTLNSSCFCYQWDAVIEVAAGFYGREAMVILSDAAKVEASQPIGQEDSDPYAPSSSNRKASNASHSENSTIF